MFSVSHLTDVLAHKTIDGNEERLFEHQHRTEQALNYIVEVYGLEAIIINLLQKIDDSGDGPLNLDPKTIMGVLFDIVIDHDIGKIRRLFQRMIRGENIKVSHSDIGFYCVLISILKSHEKGKLNTKETFVLIILSLAIYTHHGSLKDLPEAFEYAGKRFSNSIDTLRYVHGAMNVDVDEKYYELLSNNGFWKKYSEGHGKELFRQLTETCQSSNGQHNAFFILFKLVNSLLIVSDHIATMEFKTRKKYVLQFLDNEKLSKLSYEFNDRDRNGKNFNVFINANREGYLEKSEILSDISDINEIRSICNVVAERNLATVMGEGKAGNVYFLPIPTGGGKTNISMRLALHVAKKCQSRKIFYVFPFINIIEQAYDYFREFMDDSSLSRIDSKTISPINPGDERQNVAHYMDNLMINNSVLFLSHVRFFDILLRSDKNNNFAFHSLANSVVIIDEIQAYNDTVWTEIVSLLDSMASIMNMKIIIMSATIPPLQKLINWRIDTGVVSLFEQKFIDELFAHPAFSSRVSFTIDKKLKIDKGGKKEDKLKNIEKLVENIRGKSEERNRVLIVVNTVSQSQLLFKELKRLKKSKKYKNWMDHEVILLNSTFLDSHRRIIINKCKHLEKFILVSTQSVEAGVDIDCDIGFRSYAPLDSIIQVAGRINRNNRHDGPCSLYIVEDENWNMVYRDDYKSMVAQKSQYELFDKLKDGLDSYHDMDTFYHRVIDDIRADHDLDILDSSNLDIIEQCKFNAVHKNIHLIRGQNISVFIPCRLPLDGIPEHIRDDFNKYYGDLIEDDAIDGRNVWDKFQELVQSKSSFEDYVSLIVFRKVLSLFTVSLFDSFTKRGRLSWLIRDELNTYHNYYFLDDWRTLYDEENGLDTEQVKNKMGEREAMFI